MYKVVADDVPVTTYKADIVLADIQSTEPFVYEQCRDVYERSVDEQNVTLKSQAIPNTLVALMHSTTNFSRCYTLHQAHFTLMICIWHNEQIIGLQALEGHLLLWDSIANISTIESVIRLSMF